MPDTTPARDPRIQYVPLSPKGKARVTRTLIKMGL